MPLFATARFPISTGGFRRGAAEDSPRPHGAPQPALRGGPTQPPPHSPEQHHGNFGSTNTAISPPICCA